ncbi:hypothetical protein TVAG_243260 [Trichomonas vaginalis G3]|uniref:DUF3447 domain-containing protein n=1 Tax=Trichomonas vaginalis (strain ATCC PRA-98 / G3) TaxID=412133 RepID=A2FI10_TRIV3|nr:protein of unknown function (DUF3447) [Trichomonas vaginalis G3]EAX95438.1 hypothetical protein TVAG_243260 [Trichomonas vaginalis G3]KAI5542885.1 protein of unknown function (DUF3447) [Trichomonas vaginalis G3]|eukprot:XP_001308368.1 hypothetical protein [Trichomonas vaginalis G3]
MSDPGVHPSKFNESMSICKFYIDIYNMLYHLKTRNEEELNSIYKMIKTELIESKKYQPGNVIKDILNIIPYNSRCEKSYLSLAKRISDEYHATEVANVEEVSNYLFYKEYGIKLDKSADFEHFNTENVETHTRNTSYEAIMNNDCDNFVCIIQSDAFNKNQVYYGGLHIILYACTLLELCCYSGAVDCFKLLRTKFKSEITQRCLRLSFLGGNQEIMSECLKYHKPDNECMKYAIISHNLDFITFLMNEYNMQIDFRQCAEYNNLESLLVNVDQTDDINGCFIYSIRFNIPPLC